MALLVFMDSRTSLDLIFSFVSNGRTKQNDTITSSLGFLENGMNFIKTAQFFGGVFTMTARTKKRRCLWQPSPPPPLVNNK